jgi:hypothetical protein
MAEHCWRVNATLEVRKSGNAEDRDWPHMVVAISGESETVLVSGIENELEAEAICRDVAAAAYLDSLHVKPAMLKAVATAN